MSQDGKSDSDILRELLHATRSAANLQLESLKMEVLRHWNEELAKPRNANARRLLRYGFKMFSQNDEDGIIQEIFRRIGTKNRSFVEFGVSNGLECNTTKLLIEGWQGLWMEADHRSALDVLERFKPIMASGRLKLVEAMVTPESIHTLLNAGSMTGEIDFLSIDIDGNDYWVWKAIESITPRAVAIEYNSSLRPPSSLVVPYSPTRRWAGGNYFGASLEVLVRLGREKGYRIVGCNFAGVNAFFVRDDLCGDCFVEPATAEEHYEPPRYFARMMPAGHPPQVGEFETV